MPWVTPQEGWVGSSICGEEGGGGGGDYLWGQGSPAAVSQQSWLGKLDKI